MFQNNSTVTNQNTNEKSHLEDFTQNDENCLKEGDVATTDNASAQCIVKNIENSLENLTVNHLGGSKSCEIRSSQENLDGDKNQTREMQDGSVLSSDLIGDEQSDDDGEEDNSDDSDADGGGWITPSNIAQVYSSYSTYSK